MTQSKPNVIIVGGGVTGLAAANTLDQLGIGVHLIEARDRLGGHAHDWACMATQRCRDCGACLTAELVAQVQDRKNVQVHLGVALDTIQKTGARFQASWSTPADASIPADAVLLSTGFIPFDPTAFAELGYGVYDRVITTADLNGILKQESLPQVLSGIANPAIAFIQCVGSRNRRIGRDYCSQVCCKTALRQAEKILHLTPEANLTVFHMDLQVIGKMFRTRAAALADRVTLHQGVPAKILNHLEPPKLTLLHEDETTGARTAAHFDLVVLAVGMQAPAPAVALARQLGVPVDQWGFMGTLSAEPGRGAPAGVYAAGTAQGPMDILTAREQGIATAHRIAADLGIARPGRSVGEESIPVVVLGGTTEARAAAVAIARQGYTVSMLDPHGHDGPAGPADAAVNYHARAQLIRLDGTLGNYAVTFSAGDRVHTTKAAAIVVAWGADRVPAQVTGGAVQSLGDFLGAYDQNPNDLPDPIVFWLDRHGPEWKSHARRCLELALDLKRQGKTTVVAMEKMLVHGLKGQQLYDQARHAGVRFLRVGDASGVQVKVTGQEVSLTLAEATLPGTAITVTCQRLVIPEQIRPAPETTALARTLGQVQDEEGFIQATNVRHRPVGSPRRGLFFLGPCHDEVDADDMDAEIRWVTAGLATLLRGDAPPDQTAEIDESLCARCLTCLRACPHGAVMLRDGFQPVIAARACFGCGICVSSCPARAIAMEDKHPTATETAAETVVFACERSAALAAREAGLAPDTAAKSFDIRTVPCAGRLDQVALVQPLIDGARRVIVAGCHEGNCRSMIGGKTAAARARQMAEAAGEPPSAVSFQPVAANEPGKMIRILGQDVRQKEKTP